MHDEKYVVFKKEDWEEFRQNAEVDGGRVEDPRPLGDAVVIRTQDTFAGPALHAYAGAVMSELEFGRSTITANEQETDLQAAADYFHERAVEADEARRLGTARMPD